MWPRFVISQYIAQYTEVSMKLKLSLDLWIEFDEQEVEKIAQMVASLSLGHLL